MDKNLSLRQNQMEESPTVISIFGGTGDLAQTKLFSALLDLFAHGALPNKFKVIGISRKNLSDQEYQTFVADSLKSKGCDYRGEIVKKFCDHFSYLAGNFDDEVTFHCLGESLKEFDRSTGQCTNKLFYLAVPPNLYRSIFRYLDESKLMKLCDGVTSWSRILVEKPFGRDLATAEALEKDLCSRFLEEQIYRIDHYLAKDAIENIIALRFANTVLADSWHGEQIESIKIRLFETKDVSSRGSFYDGVGALRDVGQNHVLQILALLTMDPLDIEKVDSLRQARAAVLRSLTAPTKVIRGQYVGYQETKGVEPNSNTETYFKIETKLDTDRWRNVPITLEAGKALAQNINDVVVTFKDRKNSAAATTGSNNFSRQSNILTIQFSPEQRITLTVSVKKPGFSFALESRELELMHSPALDVYSPEAYERVLYDCIVGDQTRFVSGQEVMAAWRFITPLLEETVTPLVKYEPGSAGVDTLIDN